MADNVTTQSATPATIPASTLIATRTVTYSGDANAQIAPVGLVEFAGADDAKTVIDVAIGTITGAVTETAPATDTASSGLNGRLQRIAQRLTSLIALFPSALTGSGNFKVALVEDTVGSAVDASNNAIVVGNVASGASDSGNPVKTGGLAKTALPTAVSDAQRVAQLFDKFGRGVTLPVTIRDLVGTQTTTLSATTSETTIVTAIASTFNDLVMLIVSNTSASTNTRIDFRDTTGGSVLFSLQSVGGAAPVGFALPVPIPQTTVNTNWTAQCATSTTDVRIYAVFAKNK